MQFYFDAFQHQFVGTSNAFEVTAGGNLKQVTRLGRTWSNMRFLMNMYQSVTDQVTINQIKQQFELENPGQKFPIPETLSGNDRDLVLVEPTEAQLLVNKQLTFEERNLKNLHGKEKNGRGLQIQNAARANSISAKCVNQNNATLVELSKEGGKLAACADNLYRIYNKWDADKGTQLVFLDRSVAKGKNDNSLLKEYDDLINKRNQALDSGNESEAQKYNEKLEKYNIDEIEGIRQSGRGDWNAYQELKDRLIAKGIPANEIRFAQEADTTSEKQKLFNDVNSGKIRILIGSSQKMGSGTNCQERITALHQLDINYRPSDMLQREGRMIRQGNKLLDKYGHDNFKVENLVYATEQSYDAKLFSIVAAKAQAFNAIRNYEGQHAIEFEDEESVNLSELAAITSGNPLLMEKVQLQEKIKQLNLAKNIHMRQKTSIAVQVSDLQKTIANAPKQIQAEQKLKAISDQVLPNAIAHSAQAFIQIGTQKFSTKEAAQKFVNEHKLG